MKTARMTPEEAGEYASHILWAIVKVVGVCMLAPFVLILVAMLAMWLFG